MPELCLGGPRMILGGKNGVLRLCWAFLLFLFSWWGAAISLRCCWFVSLRGAMIFDV